MALLRCNFFSDVLGLSTSMTVILPQVTSQQIGMTGVAREGDSPILYLLHGASDDDTIWLRRTSIERYVAPLGLAVVMPQVDVSFYADEMHGHRYWTLLTQELPELVDGFFRLSRRREDTFVAGLSMGGYGAMKWALRHPERFAAAATLSGVMDVAGLQTRDGWRPEVMDRVFGRRRLAGSDDDLFHLLARADPAALPRLHLCCGTEDEPIIDSNRRFAAAATARGTDITVDIGPGAHEWGYWDRQIQDVLAWLPIGRPATTSAPG